MPPTDSGPGDDGARKEEWEAGPFGSDYRARSRGKKQWAVYDNSAPEGKKLVAEIGGTKQEERARLIAAAPDLFDACEALAGTIEGGTTTSREVALRLAKDAIAKARGAK